MTKRTGGGWRPPGWRTPKAYALSAAGGALLLLGLTVFDSLLLVWLGVGLALVGWLLSRRSA